MQKFFLPIPDDSLSNEQRLLASEKRAKCRGRLIKFATRVNCYKLMTTELKFETIEGGQPVYVTDVRYVYVWRLNARKLFLYCLYGEEFLGAQEDNVEYDFYEE